MKEQEIFEGNDVLEVMDDIRRSCAMFRYSKAGEQDLFDEAFSNTSDEEMKAAYEITKQKTKNYRIKWIGLILFSVLFFSAIIYLFYFQTKIDKVFQIIIAVILTAMDCYINRISFRHLLDIRVFRRFYNYLQKKVDPENYEKRNIKEKINDFIEILPIAITDETEKVVQVTLVYKEYYVEEPIWLPRKRIKLSEDGKAVVGIEKGLIMLTESQLKIK